MRHLSSSARSPPEFDTWGSKRHKNRTTFCKF